jgi:hypothetical protein
MSNKDWLLGGWAAPGRLAGSALVRLSVKFDIFTDSSSSCGARNAKGCHGYTARRRPRQQLENRRQRQRRPPKKAKAGGRYKFKSNDEGNCKGALLPFEPSARGLAASKAKAARPASRDGRYIIQLQLQRSRRDACLPAGRPALRTATATSKFQVARAFPREVRRLKPRCSSATEF